MSVDPGPKSSRRPPRLGILILSLLVLPAACRDSGGRSASGSGTVMLAAAFDGLSFAFPVDLLQHPGDDDRWYVVQKEGVVETFLASDPAGTRAVAVSVPGIDSSAERGLLGMAFHPDFATTGEVFLSFVLADAGEGTSVVARYRSLDDGLSFVPDADPVVLSLAQPASNHNAGDLDFGPDGMLYIAFGDGGGSGDPFGNGQDLDTWFGCILRIDPDAARPYAVPADNPFVGQAGRDEIWAWGLRNPWRMSFDPATGALWVGDVGQKAVEEIDVIVRGGNHGWNEVEGDLTYPGGEAAPVSSFVEPVIVHHQPEYRSITGGVVAGADAIEPLRGRYVYGDFVTGLLHAYDPAAESTELLLDTGRKIVSFTRARSGAIYLVDFGSTGGLWEIRPVEGE